MAGDEAMTMSPESAQRRVVAGASSKPFHRRRDAGPSFWGPGDLYTFLVTGEESGGAYFSMLAVVPPQGGPPPHIHRNEAETFYVLEGTPTFRLGDDRIVAAQAISSTCRRASSTASAISRICRCA